MIPDRIKQIVGTSAIAAVLVALCVVLYDFKASIAFLATSGWVILNFIAWTIIMGAALRGKDEPANPMGLMVGLLAKLILLGGGLAAMIVFAPYTRAQLFAIVGGLSFVLLVAVMKALGSRLTTSADLSPTLINKDAAEKV